MNIVAVILARAGSKGLPDKCVRDLLGRPVIAYTFDHALAATRVNAVVFTTDSEPAKQIARGLGITVVDRPAALATDTATVDSAARHAIEAWERSTGCRADVVVLLYGNIPVRPAGLIDCAVGHLIATGADSVRSVAPVTKQHPDWVHRMAGDRMTQFRPNSIYRRQDLEPLYYHDGAVAAVTREALFGASPGDHQSFLGRDRRAIVLNPEDVVDIDGPIDLYLAEAILRAQAGTKGRGNAGHQNRDREGAVENVETSKHRNEGAESAPSWSRGSVASAFPGRQSTVRRDMRMAHRAVGPSHPVFVIAEAGVNHNGSLETALQLVDIAAEAGADAVKFQMFRATDLVSPDAATAPYQEGRTGLRSQRDMLADLELTEEEFARIKRRCEEKGIVFLATPFGLGEVQKLVELGAAAIKIASTDLTNRPLIDRALDSGLPLILSTGASTEEEIRSTVEHVVDSGAVDRLILLHCVSCYPAPVESVNLRAIASLRDAFDVVTGLSDHTTSVETGAWAVAAGACVLEKHFTLDHRLPGPDHAMSLEPAELRDYVHAAREAQKAMGHGQLGMNALEEPVRTAARRSVTAAIDIPAGAVLSAGHLTLKRPGTGIAPADLPKLLGRRTRRSIPRDTLLTWDLLA